jgi:hypothetical protein
MFERKEEREGEKLNVGTLYMFDKSATVSPDK